MMWGETTVGAEFEVQLGKMLDAERNKGESKLYVGNRAVQWGRIDLTGAGLVPLSKSDQLKFRLRRGDLLVCEGGEVGRGAIWDHDIECYFQKAIHRLRTRRGYRPEVLLGLLELRAKSSGFADYVTQTSIAHLPRDKFLTLQIPSIPAAEQERIAAVLESANDLIGSLEKLITKKRAIKQGMLQELLAGHTRLAGFTGRWAPVLLGDVGATYGGLVGKSRRDFGRGSERFVTFVEVMRDARLRGTGLARVDVKRGERQNVVRYGDVIFNGSSETPDEVALAAAVEFDRPGVFLNSFCFGYRPSSRAVIDPLFLAYFFRAVPGRELIVSLAQGSTRFNIAKTKLMRVPIVLPEYGEQRAIADVIRAADDEITALERRLESTRAIKQGMMQELLTGRTRLPVGEEVSV